MQQILKFKIEMFDVRTRRSIIIVDDSQFVVNIRINKSISLDNTATITFAKNKSYELLPMEHILKLYNYVKIHLTLKSYNPTSDPQDFYFSGFIQKINKTAQFASSPSAAVSIVVGDYASMMKTTFYTKNLTFLEILNQKVDIFRMLTFSDQAGDLNKELISGIYSPTQLGFIFFVFIFFKFMYRIVYDEHGKKKKTTSQFGKESTEIFKDFKIYTPFGFDIDGTSGGQSMFKGQEQSPDIYRELQGVAFELFKYMFPEPIFEFSTYETEKSVILQIRLTPFMRFDRKLIDPIKESSGRKGGGFDVASYDVIEKYEFGFNRIASVRQVTGLSPADLLIKHLDSGEPDKSLMKLLADTLGESKGLDIKQLVASPEESDLITEDLFKINYIDANYVESINMERDASSVVNIIWTVCTSDTTIMRWGGRELVYAYLEEELDKVGGPEQFGEYVKKQFDDNFEPNPSFFVNYKNVFNNQFVSGDMNYFGLREFEIRWNYLSIQNSNVYFILNYVDTEILKKIRNDSKDKDAVKKLDFILTRRENSSEEGRTSTPAYPRGIFKPTIAPDFKSMVPSHVPFDSMRRSVSAEFTPKPSRSKKSNLKEALKNPSFLSSVKKFNLDVKDLNNADRISQILADSKQKDLRMTAGFIAKINKVVSDAYRENEHLYECQITKPLDLSVLPGQVVESLYEGGINVISPVFKGYVTSVSHNIDFNEAIMKTAFTLSRAASDDSGIVEENE